MPKTELQQAVQAASIPETIEAIVLPSTDAARRLAPLFAEELTVYSQDSRNKTKFHLHDPLTGKVLTQVNTGASVDWETTLDLRSPSNA